MPDLISIEAWEQCSGLPVQSQQEQPLAGPPQGRSVQQERQAACATSEGADDLRSEIEKISSDLPALMPGPPSGIPDARVHLPDVDASELLQPLAGALRQELGSRTPPSATAAPSWHHPAGLLAEPKPVRSFDAQLRNKAELQSRKGVAALHRWAPLTAASTCLALCHISQAD